MLFFVFDSKVCRVCGNLCVKNATLIHLHDKKVVELESGCGLVRGIAALLREHVLLTDFPDRLKLLKKNVQKNLYANVQVSATVIELTCGDHPHPKLMNPSPDYVLGPDVIYSEEVVIHLIETFVELCESQTMIILAGEFRNEYFLEPAMKV
ncbi:uncharacterized protein LOC141724924 isoform X2 [Apium graveolens]|uniref:uncharacterized protein LOC141724924 isoform X2 n=1 Tax=Apium graveolens TaxID=4045 RepID=UPI003D7AB8D4